MIKECKILKANEYMTLVKYGDVDVQLPSVHTKEQTVIVSYENGKYFVVDNEYKKTARQAQPKSKKTTNKITVKPIEEEALQDA